jgi:8-oxo-dGTP diphosphatase
MSAVPILVVAAVIHLAGTPEKILIVRRGPGQSGAGFWEFPGGKVELGESPEQALHREIEEELGIRIHVQNLIGEDVHHYPTKSIRLRVYKAEALQEKLTLSEHDDFKWCLPSEINLEELSAADRPFIAKL